MAEPGIELAAVTILQRGVELDNKRRFTEALICYQEGLQLLFNLVKGGMDSQKKAHFRSKIEDYMSRAEKLKAFIKKEKESGKYHEQIHIENDSTGHDYKMVFGRFLDEHVIQVDVEDPYIRSFHQCQNFLRLCELLVKSCKNLKKISLLTSLDGNGKDQMQKLQSLSNDLHNRYNVMLTVDISETLHDRQIKLSNGWIIKIGRGLDYFKPPAGKFSLGFFDYDLRHCHETTVDIFHSKDVKLV